MEREFIFRGGKLLTSKIKVVILYLWLGGKDKIVDKMVKEKGNGKDY